MPLKENPSICIFSGAGMSAESGISTFRDSNGLWENYSIDEVATPQAWTKDPNLVTAFYNARRKNVLDAQPNEAHQAIAALESIGNVQIITQNIDDLHERAGSENVLHLHGNIRMAKSSGPNQEKQYFPIEGWELTESDVCPEGFRLRPHVVWFGEAVPAYEKAAVLLSQVDILIVIGTSLQVHPAAGLIHYAENAQKCFIIDPKVDELDVPSTFVKINATASEGMRQFKEWIEKELL
ncbi:MAG: NAD-dependent deacetylase [Crocinitomicaceae bacterium]